MATLEATAYDVPHWDCPACGEVNGENGIDDATGQQTCWSCDATVTVTN
ncbi:hypothetical protein [Paenarthrobacter ilicis]